MATVLIYRPQGEHPPRTKMGELELGRVHSLSEDLAAPYLLKSFVVMPREAASAKPEALAAMYADAKKIADDEAARLFLALGTSLVTNDVFGGVATAVADGEVQPITVTNPGPDAQSEPASRRRGGERE